jgi:glucuronosyltransferase
MGWMLPVGNDLLDIGAHCSKKDKPLSEDLKAFVEDPKSKGREFEEQFIPSFLGTIYIAFGTYANWTAAPDRVLKAFGYTFARLSDYRIIFSFNGDPQRLPRLEHVKLIEWAPQTTILSHPKTVLFFSHGGLKRWGCF